MHQDKLDGVHRRHESTGRESQNRLPRLTHNEQNRGEPLQNRTEGQMLKGHSQLMVRDRRESPKLQESSSRAQQVILKNRQRIRQLSLLEKRIVSQRVLPRYDVSPRGEIRVGSPRLQAIQKQSESLKRLVDRAVQNVKKKLLVNGKQHETNQANSDKSLRQSKLAQNKQPSTIVEKDEPVNLKAMIGYTAEMREKMQAKSSNLSEQTKAVQPVLRVPTPKVVTKKEPISKSLKAIKKPFELPQDQEMKKYLRELKSKVKELESLE